MIEIASAYVGILIVRDNPRRADTTQGREGGSHKAGKESDSTLPNSAEHVTNMQT